MSSTAVKLGKNAALYRNSTGNYASPTWVLIDNVRDLKAPASKKEAESSIRGAGAYVLTQGTLIQLGVEFNMNYDPADAQWVALQTSFLTLVAVEMLVLDKPSATGAQGWRASFEVMKFDEGQPLEGIVTTDVEAKPTMSANAPAWWTVP
jgi:hypothetical protein